MLQIVAYSSWKTRDTNNVFNDEIIKTVQDILKTVKQETDLALFKYTKQFDNVIMN